MAMRPAILTTVVAFLAATVVAASVACRPRAESGAALDVTWTLSRRAVGPATLTVTLREAGAPVNGATVRVEGHMTHPGMTPIQAMAAATDRGRGVYRADIEFTMAGDWALLISAVLPDGRRIERRLDIEVRRTG